MQDNSENLNGISVFLPAYNEEDNIDYPRRFPAFELFTMRKIHAWAEPYAPDLPAQGKIWFSTPMPITLLI